MPGASYTQTSFLGGEISQAYQGRYDLPAYRISMAVCLNFMPIETGALARRGGTQFCGTTRGGKAGRIIPFDVAGGNPIYLEFTDLFLRFRVGPALVTTNDGDPVVAISAANPAVMQVVADNGWQTGNQIYFIALGTTAPILQNRLFSITRVDGTHYSLADAITGASIDGSTIGPVASTAVPVRVREIATSYGAGSWQSIRSVQAEQQTVLLNGSQPQVLTLVTPPSGAWQPTFSLSASNFIDGPYLDPFNGSICTYDVLVGNVTLTFTFAAYSATVSYNVGDYVLNGGNGYQSLANANLNNAPPNASFWLPVPGGAPVGPNGFTAADIGRHIRLFSEPTAWAVGTAYTLAAKTVVKFNGSYYRVTADSTGTTPGTDATTWAVVTGAQYAVWTWGRVLSVSGAGLISPSVAIGNYTTLSAAFDGTTSKNHTASASESATVTTYPAWVQGGSNSSGDGVYYAGNLYRAAHTFAPWSGGTYAAGSYVSFGGSYYIAAATNAGKPPTSGGIWVNIGTENPGNTNMWSSLGAAPSVSVDAYAGQDFHSAAKVLAYATVFPSTDLGFGNLRNGVLTLNLRGKHTAPANAADGTIIGTTGAINNTTSPVTITSTDTATAWEYFWIEAVATETAPFPDDGSHTFTLSFYLAQAQFFNANVANGSVVTIQLAGPPLLYAAGTVINTWRAGVYSNTPGGGPTCGTYADGRLWLGGVVDNRFDISVANQILNFAPTGPDGSVAPSSAISYTLNAPDVNPILWMTPDLQGVLMGTQKREWLITPASTASGIGPGNIVGNPATHIGCAAIEPRRTEHTLVFVQKHARKILEAFPDVFSGKFTAPNLLEKARHLSTSAIQEIAYQQELNPVIWARCADGSWFGLTYKRDTLMTSQGPTYCAPHRHVLGSGRLVESIAVGPSQDGTLDSLMMVTNDASGIRHVELMTGYFEETSALQNAWHLDDAVVPSSFTISQTTPAPYGGITLNGLWHLNGKTVQVFAGGLDCGAGEGGAIADFVVTNGSLTVPFGDGVSAGSGRGLFTAAFVNSFASTIPIVVGFAFTSDAQLLRPNKPEETGARNGPGFGKKRRTHKYALQTVNTHGLSIGTSFTKLDPIIWKDDSSDNYPANQLFTGVQSSESLTDDYSYDGMICWRATRMLPAMITVAGGMLETVDQ